MVTLGVLSGGAPSPWGPFPTGRLPCLPPLASALSGTGLRPVLP